MLAEYGRMIGDLSSQRRGQGGQGGQGNFPVKVPGRLPILTTETLGTVQVGYPPACPRFPPRWAEGVVGCMDLVRVEVLLTNQLTGSFIGTCCIGMCKQWFEESFVGFCGVSISPCVSMSPQSFHVKPS